MAAGNEKRRLRGMLLPAGLSLWDQNKKHCRGVKKKMTGASTSFGG